MSLKPQRILGIALAIFLASYRPLSAQTNFPAEPLALQGYDSVAYFADGKASRGTEKYQISWDGARYQFVTAEHREAFQRDADKFVPQFGSLCTMGLAAGKRVAADPEAWLIMNGKLYLFSSTNARDKFLQNPADYLAKAERAEKAPQ